MQPILCAAALAAALLASACSTAPGVVAAAVPADVGETRMITCADIFDAITAARPYRGAVPVEETLEIMGATVGIAIDPECLAALKDCIHCLPPIWVRIQQPPAAPMKKPAMGCMAGLVLNASAAQPLWVTVG